MKRGSLGMIETWGFTPAVVAVDTGMKAAPVSLLTVKMTYPARMTVAFTGDVAAVGAAVSAASAAAARIGQVIATRVIARPGADLLKALIGDPGPEVSPPPAPPVAPDATPQPLETPTPETAGKREPAPPPAVLQEDGADATRIVELPVKADANPTEVAPAAAGIDRIEDEENQKTAAPKTSAETAGRPKPQPSSKPAASKKQAPKKKPKAAAKRKPSRSPS